MLQKFMHSEKKNALPWFVAWRNPSRKQGNGSIISDKSIQQEKVYKKSPNIKVSKIIYMMKCICLFS